MTKTQYSDTENDEICDATRTGYEDELDKLVRGGRGDGSGANELRVYLYRLSEASQRPRGQRIPAAMEWQEGGD